MQVNTSHISLGYIPFEPEAANLFFQLVSSRYKHASLIVTSNKVFGRWGEVFGDDIVAAAMIDRLVHHAEVIALKDVDAAARRSRVDGNSACGSAASRFTSQSSCPVGRRAGVKALVRGCPPDAVVSLALEAVSQSGAGAL